MDKFKTIVAAAALGLVAATGAQAQSGGGAPVGGAASSSAPSSSSAQSPSQVTCEDRAVQLITTRRHSARSAWNADHPQHYSERSTERLDTQQQHEPEQWHDAQSLAAGQ